MVLFCQVVQLKISAITENQIYPYLKIFFVVKYGKLIKVKLNKQYLESHNSKLSKSFEFLNSKNSNFEQLNSEI